MNQRWEIVGSETGAECRYYRGDFQVYLFEAMSIEQALARVLDRQLRLMHFPASLGNREQVNDHIVGRAVYYREVPAIITDFDGERGRVRIIVDDPIRREFPPEPWDGEGALSSASVWEDLLSPKIHWHREVGE